MSYFTDAELPAYGALTREFAICDAWFCSHLGGTLRAAEGSVWCRRVASAWAET